MKTKSKILLALAFLTAGTIAAASTSTFAWFTTTRSVKLTYSSVSVINKQGNLEAKIYKFDTVGATKWGTGADSVTASTTISELSSADGVKFAKPKWDTVVGGKIIANQDAVAGVDYSVAVVEVTNSGVNALDIYLDNGTKIAANSASNEDKAAANLSRVAINAVTPEGGNIANIPHSAPTEASGTKVFENNTTVQDVTLVPGKYLDATNTPIENYNAALNDVPADTYFVNEAGFSALTASNLVAKQKLMANLGGGKTAYFVVTVWLEGTKESSDYFNSSAGGSVKISLNLAAFDVAA